MSSGSAPVDIAAKEPPVGHIAQQGMQPSFATELNLNTIEHGIYGNLMNGLGSFMGALGSVPCIVCCPNPYKRIEQGYVGLVSRFGKFYKCSDPGLIKINPLTEKIQRVDVKIQIQEISRQIIMTKDNVNVSLDAVLYWHIIDPYQAQFGVTDVRKCLIERTRTTLRHVLGSRVLQDCIENREAIASEIEDIIGPAAKLWGVKIESILIKDLSFTKELQESLSSAAQAKRIGESKVIAAKAEVDSAKLMREAADILNTSSAMQIRYLETLNGMARNPHTKIVFLPGSTSDGPQLDAPKSSMYELLSSR
ncbi:hypothetical protein INT43_000289 [Umbelopsis isabellina]|uniref:Band 7 domain-containing protein n=1 Tax=Mortierella isabellina TaxID=91625 RepID=A0A8H7Q307_MORIS|nr:hypothetical protein INT43_000289 [Umbelopsis isabellina]